MDMYSIGFAIGTLLGILIVFYPPVGFIMALLKKDMKMIKIFGSVTGIYILIAMALLFL